MASAPVALAQSASNEAWIGQTGDTNTIAITQTGVGNSAGANASTLEINQGASGSNTARYNTLTIDQFGRNNKAGAVTLTEPGTPQGINQLGDRNSAGVSQSTGRDSGSNSIGAIYQESLTGLSNIANSLDIDQNEGEGDGTASHVIGFVSQTNTADDLGANIVRLLQSGGIDNAGDIVGRVVQRGYGNILRAKQRLQNNEIGAARQTGHDNEMTLLQGEGETNTIAEATQLGGFNHAKVTQSGERNNIASVYQNNEGMAISGNTLVVTLAGNDNGGDGLGGPGAFQTDEAKAVSVYQGVFSQIGEDNDISFTVNGGNENRFGISQTGDGNGAIVAIGRTTGPSAVYASNNEVAVVQIGDENGFSAALIGIDDSIGATVQGSYNMLWFEQTGDGNRIGAEIDGGHNNDSNSSAVGGFGGDVRSLADSLGLTPGKGLQSGGLNQASIRVTGDGNLFAFRQHGDENAASFDISGLSNQTVVSQAGDTNSAQVKQNGTGNSMAISQF